MREVFVVIGSVGEYSDRDEYPVIVYGEEVQAQTHAEHAQAAARAWETARWNMLEHDAWDYYDPIPDEFIRFDPLRNTEAHDFNRSSLATYSVAKVPFHG